MANMDIWDKVSQPPRQALKTIKGGRLAGMTDINPQWRFKVMTETFGPCGDGWTYTIDKLWTEPGADGAVMAFALVSLRTAKSGTASLWNDPIPGIGGSAMIAKESGGLRGNDEAYKMAVTDALSVAMKALGVAADIYAGLWDGTKYTETPKTAHKPSDGALEHLEPDMQTHVKDVADEVKLKVVKGDIKGAYEWLQAANLDADAKVACWDLIQPPHIRTAITNYANGLKSGKLS